ncbi:MAG: 16S rRNA (cytosine(967)-C(5))-methyltransferase RsmB [Lachnospiraceae bacterium]|nr:16S rRNA (cytosine(967)-C(5))-methyltransferase RsmB [Lachnospiraceae bacterium]
MTRHNGKGTGSVSENLRLISLEVLLKWEKEGGSCDAMITEVLENYAYLGRESRSFIKRLTEGCIENKILLDHLIDNHSKIKVNKLKPVVRVILRLGMYQLYFMDHVPPHAAINEAVKLARIKHLGALSGYINAVLRNADRERTDIEAIKDLSIRYSCPEWLCELFLRDHGREATEKLLRSFIGAKKLYIRVNRVKTDAESLAERLEKAGITVREVPGFEEALEIEGIDSLKRIPEFSLGLFTVQDISSMSVGRLIEPKKGLKVLDLCAAPGGKSTHAAERLRGYGTVEARDISDKKLELIRENVDRLGLENVLVKLSDAALYDEESRDKYDVMIADLPCSGLGVIGRKNEIKYRLKKEDIEALAKLQRAMLDASCRYVHIGGRLIFSVCTVTREETYMQREYIESLGFKLVDERLFLPGAEDSDGFYYAVFTREK